MSSQTPLVIFLVPLLNLAAEISVLSIGFLLSVGDLSLRPDIQLSTGNFLNFTNYFCVINE